MSTQTSTTPDYPSPSAFHHALDAVEAAGGTGITLTDLASAPVYDSYTHAKRTIDILTTHNILDTIVSTAHAEERTLIIPGYWLVNGDETDLDWAVGVLSG